MRYLSVYLFNSQLNEHEAGKRFLNNNNYCSSSSQHPVHHLQHSFVIQTRNAFSSQNGWPEVFIIISYFLWFTSGDTHCLTDRENVELIKWKDLYFYNKVFTTVKPNYQLHSTPKHESLSKKWILKLFPNNNKIVSEYLIFRGKLYVSNQ